MANEALCKVLCHNVCCLIQSTYELGVEATFWGGDPFEPKGAAESIEDKGAVDEGIEVLAWL